MVTMSNFPPNQRKDIILFQSLLGDGKDENISTLANGGDCCDYRYIRKNENVPRGWLPESLTEWTGKFDKETEN